jgi:hypothetical protein
MQDYPRQNDAVAHKDCHDVSQCIAAPDVSPQLVGAFLGIRRAAMGRRVESEAKFFNDFSRACMRARAREGRDGSGA